MGIKNKNRNLNFYLYLSLAINCICVIIVFVMIYKYWKSKVRGQQVTQKGEEDHKDVMRISFGS